jgi:hypothetical protein
MMMHEEEEGVGKAWADNIKCNVIDDVVAEST